MLNNKAIGIVFANMHDSSVGDMTAKRSMASLPFGGRYRLIDFALSSFTDAGITKVGVIAKTNYSSLMDHLGSGRQYDLARKRGGLSIFPPHRYFEETESLYHGRVQALYNILNYIRNSVESHVVMTDSDFVCNIDTSALIAYHISSNADVTMLCCDQVPDSEMEKNCVEVRVNEDGRAVEMYMNRSVEGCLLSMNVFVVAKDMLVRLVEDAISSMYQYFERDILAKRINELNIMVYRHTGFARRIYSTKSYYEANMSLLSYENLSALFVANRPVFTKVRDEAPVRYGLNAKVHNVLLADGCVVEGTVENCVLFRGVKVEEGAVVRNSILMQDTVVSRDANINYIITDKDVHISSDRILDGDISYPVYIKKASVV